MGVSVDVWRARIGMFGIGSQSTKIQCVSCLLGKALLLAVFHFSYLMTLLMIGNVESNPGPSLKPCPICAHEAITISAHLSHQRSHEVDCNFKFFCPLPTCHYQFAKLKTLSAHVSSHAVSRDDVLHGDPVCSKCKICDRTLASKPAMLRHFKNIHLDQGKSYKCPLRENCGSVRKFHLKARFNSHLSTHHVGWKEDYGSLATSMPTVDQEFGMDVEEDIPQEYPFNLYADGASDHGSEGDLWQAVPDDGAGPCNDINSSHDSDSSSCFEALDGYESEKIVFHIAKFYAMLGHLSVPARTVQKIASRLTYLSEVLQHGLRHRLTQRLSKAGLSGEQISDVVDKVFQDDPLYNSHHSSGPGPKLTSIALRKSYFQKNFKYVAPVERNLKIQSRDRSAVYYYVPPKETLEVMLQDQTVQKAMDDSFSEMDNADPSIISNYTHGLVFKSRQVPKKRLDLFIFLDAFGCVNVIGSMKSKYKILGCYLTIGNLKPHQRSRLKSKRLVLLVLENIMNSIENGFDKTFGKLVSDLKDLIQCGIMFKGEVIPVRLQFLLGDNLGQHTVGGFQEQFSTTHYFCRFCEISRKEFVEDCSLDYPVFREAAWRTPRKYKRALRKMSELEVESYSGIKKNSIFNSLEHFHVSDPGQPGCLGHDLFIGGVVDVDMACMIQYFINNGWFTLDPLNQRIKKFCFKGSDVTNKPAPVHESGKKLGGHAVQNWTLLRMFVILVADLPTINTSDPVWELYLLLKKVCEFAMAPALKTSQIDEMDILIKQYLGKKKILGNKYKPKHHYFSHLGKLYLQLGPLRHLWTLGFEHFHQQFKRTARVSRNFINLTKLLASNHQYSQAYQCTGDLFPSEPELHSDPIPLIPDIYGEQLKNFIEASNISSYAMVADKITIEEICFEVNIDWLLLQKLDLEDSYHIAKIRLIILEGNNSPKFVVEKHKAVFLDHYGVYRIEKQLIGLSLITFQDLQDPTTYPSYKLLGKKCLSLKNTLLQ